MDTSLDSLDPRFKPYVFAFLARTVEARIPLIIVNTKRTDAEQADALARGVSWIKRSKHQDGLAIDVAPYQQYILHGTNKIQWDATDPVWLRIGQLAESVSPMLAWGGRWLKTPDMGHIEYVGSTAPGGVPV